MGFQPANVRDTSVRQRVVGVANEPKDALHEKTVLLLLLFVWLLPETGGAMPEPAGVSGLASHVQEYKFAFHIFVTQYENNLISLRICSPPQ